MDELTLRLHTKFMRGIVTKILSKLIASKIGCKMDIQLNAIEVTTEEGKVRLHANVDACMTNDEFTKLLKSIDLI